MALQVQPGTLNGNPIQFNGAFGQKGTLYADPPPPVAGGSQLPAGTLRRNDTGCIARVSNYPSRPHR